MAIATIPQAIARGDISIYLSTIDNAKGSLFTSRRANPTSPVTIAMVTDALRWGYEGGAQTDTSLREVANYLIWLVGKYGQQAEAIINGGSGGGGSVIPTPTGIQYPFYIHSSDFESDGVTYLNSNIAGVNLALFINEYTQQFFPGTDFTYVAGGGFTITAGGFDANNFDYTIRVERYFPIPT